MCGGGNLTQVTPVYATGAFQKIVRMVEMRKKKKDFYRVLDIDHSASPSEIKKAYRAAAKKFHPDVSAKNDRKFKQVLEAYETLSDPQKRIAYDKEDQSGVVSHPKPQEPFQPNDFPLDIFDGIDRAFGELNDFWVDLAPGLFTEVKEGQREQSVEIILTPDEAREGGEISFDIPFWTTCNRCRGTGRSQGLICGRCRGEGAERSRKKVTVAIPPGARDGMRTCIPAGAEDRFETNLDVTLRIRQPSVKVRH